MADRAARQGDERRAAARPSSGSPDELSTLIVAASADGIVAVDDQGIIRLANRAAQRLLARPARDLIGSSFGFPVVAGRSAEVELRLPGGGERVVEMRTASTKLDGEHLQIVALRDVTFRKQAERDLETALEQRNAVIAVAAHELHSPLAAIGVLAHVLADQHAAQATMPPADIAHIIDRIIGLTSRLQLLVDRLLTAARIDAVGVRPVREPVPPLRRERLAVGEGGGELRVELVRLSMRANRPSLRTDPPACSTSSCRRTPSPPTTTNRA